MNRTNLPLIALIALLAVNVVQANSSWSQWAIGSLFNRESAKIMAGVTGAAMVHGTAQRYMTTDVIGSRQASYLNGTSVESLYEMKPFAVPLYSVGIGLLATAVTRIGSSPLSASDMIKPVGVGMGIVAASYVAAAGVHHLCSRSPVRTKERTRNIIAGNAYDFASSVTPWVVAGTTGYILYDRYTRS